MIHNAAPIQIDLNNFPMYKYLKTYCFYYFSFGSSYEFVGGNSLVEIEGWGQEGRGCRDGDRGIDLVKGGKIEKMWIKLSPEPICFFTNPVV